MRSSYAIYDQASGVIRKVVSCAPDMLPLQHGDDQSALPCEQGLFDAGYAVIGGQIVPIPFAGNNPPPQEIL